MLLALALPLLSCTRRAPDAPATPAGLTVVNAQSENRPTYVDLGTLPYGEKREHVFRIRNDEARPVRIQDMIATCGCAVPRISYRAADGSIVEGRPSSRDGVITLPPGAVAELSVAVDTQHVERMNLDKLASVRVRSDSSATPFLTLELHLLVERLLRAVPAAIELGQTPQSAGKTGSADVVVDVPGSRPRVLGVESVQGPFTATVDETEVAGVTTWIVAAAANPGLPLGPVSGKVVLSVTQADGTGIGRTFAIPVNAQIAQDVVLRPPVMLFGAFDRGKPARVEAQLVALVPGERVRIERARVSAVPEGAAPWIAARVEPVDPGPDGAAAAWDVVLECSQDQAEPAFSGTLVLETDHPRVPEIRVPFSGATR